MLGVSKRFKAFQWISLDFRELQRASAEQKRSLRESQGNFQDESEHFCVGFRRNQGATEEYKRSSRISGIDLRWASRSFKRLPGVAGVSAEFCEKKNDKTYK